MGGHILIGKSGAKCPVERGENFIPFEMWRLQMGEIPLRRPLAPQLCRINQRLLKNSTRARRVTEFPADGVMGAQVDV
jgi:hypothetical protein